MHAYTHEHIHTHVYVHICTLICTHLQTTIFIYTHAQVYMHKPPYKVLIFTYIYKCTFSSENWLLSQPLLLHLVVARPPHCPASLLSLLSQILSFLSTSLTRILALNLPGIHIFSVTFKWTLSMVVWVWSAPLMSMATFSALRMGGWHQGNKE